MFSVKRNFCNCFKSYIIVKSVGTLLRQSLFEPPISRYWGGNRSVPMLTLRINLSLHVQQCSYDIFCFLPESSNYYKDSWWLTKALAIRSMLWTLIVCQTPGNAEITKTNTTRKTESFHTFEEVTFHNWADSWALWKAQIVCLKMTRVGQANSINSPCGQGSCPPLGGGVRHGFQNLSASP